MYLSELTWLQARDVLTADCVMLLPLGAAAKEHGPHLRLDNDLVLAEYLARRVDDRGNVVVMPTLNYHYYPSFSAYAGSTSLRMETARDLTVDAINSLAAFGPRRFYVLNTGISTVRPLRAAASTLFTQGKLMHYTRIDEAGEAAARSVQEQTGGSHADEIETSMMLYIAPDRVDMSLAADDFHPGKGPLTPEKKLPGVYSPSGIYGNARLATVEKGQLIVEAMVADILRDISALRSAPLPESALK